MSAQPADPSVDKFAVTIVTSAVIGLIVMISFNVLRVIFPKVYRPRIEEPPYPHWWIPVLWVWYCIWIKDSTIRKTHGLDVLTRLRFIRGLMLLCVGMMLGCVVLLPINGVGPNKNRSDSDPKQTTGLEILTMSNLESNSNSFWAHTIFTVIISFMAMATMWFLSWQWVTDRQKWLAKSRYGRKYTLLFRGLPKRLQSEEALTAWCEEAYPTGVKACHLLRKAKGLKKKQKKYQKYSNKLAKADWVWAKAQEKHNGGDADESRSDSKESDDELGNNNHQVDRPTTRTKLFNLVGKKVDSIDYFSEKKAKWRHIVEGRLSGESGRVYKPTETALVTFDSPFVTRCHHHPILFASDSPTNSWPSIIRSFLPFLFNASVEPAPEPNAILWDSVTQTGASRAVRWVCVTFVLLILVVFWTVPVGFLASIGNLSSLSGVSGFGWVNGVTNLAPIGQGFIEGFLPVLVLIILMALLVPLIKLLTWLKGQNTYSDWLGDIFTTYFYFLIINVLLVSTLVGGVWTVIQDIINDPSSIPEFFAQTLPAQSTYFILYVITKTGMVGLDLLRIPNLLVWLLKYYLLAKTPEEKAKASLPPQPSPAPSVADRMLIFAITICYSVMAPLIVPFGVVYFVLAYFTDKYNAVFVEKCSWEAGGFLWSYIYPRFFIVLILFQLMMWGLLSVNKFIPVVILLPLPPLAILEWVLIAKAWNHVGDYGTLESDRQRWKMKITGDADEDNRDKEEKDMDGKWEEWKSAYIQPEFRPIDDPHDVEMQETD